MRTVLLLSIVLAACGSDGPTHWNKQPLETFEGTNDGVTFTLQMPKGMQKSKVESKYSVEWGYHQDVRGEDYVFAPSVSVSKASKRKTLAAAIEGDSDIKAPADVVFKEETAAGWVYAKENSSRRGKEDFIVTGQTNIGEDAALTCSVRVYPLSKGGKAKDDIPLVAKMCQSLKAK